MPTQPAYRHVLMLIAATACWGVGTVVTKEVLDEDVAALTLLTLQLASSCVFLAAMCLLQRAHLNPGIAYALGLIGLSSITASMSVLLWAAEPVLILLFAAALLREHIRAAMAAALGVGMLGVVLVVYRPGPTGDAVGIALTLAAVAASANVSWTASGSALHSSSAPPLSPQYDKGSEPRRQSE